MNVIKKLYDNGFVALLGVPVDFPTYPRGHVFSFDGISYRSYYSKSLSVGIRYYFCKVLKNEC